MKPKISVIIPVYNTGKYLARCLDSVLGQTFTDFEVICINDGSTDNSGEILAQYAKTDKRIKVINQTNSGVVNARNNGVEQSRADLIFPLDSDDIILPTALEKMYTAINAKRGDIITCRVARFGGEHGEMVLPRPSKINMARQNCLVNAALMRKSDFKLAGGYSHDCDVALEDYDLWLNLVFNHNKKIYRIPEILFLYRIKDASESRNMCGKVLNEHMVQDIYKKYSNIQKYAIYCKLKKTYKYLFEIRHKNKHDIVRILRLPFLVIKNHNCVRLFNFIPLAKWYILNEKKYIKIFDMFPIYTGNFFKKIAGNYRRIIKRIHKKQAIRIGFLVRENSKWSYEKLYDLFNNNQHIEPIILLVLENNPLCDIEKNVVFFKTKNYQIIANKNDFINTGLDILFYEQPWFDLAGDFTPTKLSKHVLTYYVPYGIELDKIDETMKYLYDFYKTLFKTLTFNSIASQELGRYNIFNTLPVGHPRLDEYLSSTCKTRIWKTRKFRIIYAPHHSFGDSLLKMASWEWNGKHILNLAKANQDTTEWVFKPHPRFKLELAKLLGSEKGAEKIFTEWASVSTIYDRGNYFDLFKGADLMISDCCSFKIEWLPTKKPFIELCSHYQGKAIYKEHEHYAAGYYKANTISDIDKFFNMITKKHQDPLRPLRIKLAAEIPMGANDKIYKLILSLCPNLH